MRKYALRYLVFWLPAVLVAYFYTLDSNLSITLQWFTAFFMILGWSVNTGMAAYHTPRSALSLLLCYTGFHILLIVCLASADRRSGLYLLLRSFGGILSYKPLGILLRAVRTMVALPEFFVLGILAGGCALGWIIGVVQRRISPNPYSPRIRKI